MDTEEEALDCPVCLERYDSGKRTPKMMPCLHTVCATCLLDLVQSTASSEDYESLDLIQPTSPTRRVPPNPSPRPRHPLLRRLSGHARPLPQLPPNARPPSAPPPVPTRESKPQLSARPRTAPSAIPKDLEPQIPKDKEVPCPLCRTSISTSKLQTNRYVLAHMRDLARLKSAPASSSDNFWCIVCSCQAKEGCSNHDVSPVDKWIETLEASKEALRSSLDDRLRSHTSVLEGTESVVKIVFHALTKASKQVWDERQVCDGLKEELTRVEEDLAPNENPFQKATDLNRKLDSLRELDTRITELENGVSSTEVFLWRQNDKLFISTPEPDRTVIISVCEGEHTG